MSTLSAKKNMSCLSFNLILKHIYKMGRPFVFCDLPFILCLERFIFVIYSLSFVLNGLFFCSLTKIFNNFMIAIFKIINYRMSFYFLIIFLLEMLLLLWYCYDVMLLMQKGFDSFDETVSPLFEVSLFRIYKNSIG